MNQLSALITLFVWCTAASICQSTADSVLSLERIFKKPYIAGTRPGDPNISPDGSLMIFAWDQNRENTMRSWMVMSDGRGLHQIADTLAGGFAWSLDGKTLACTRKGDIFLTDTAFTTFTRLTKTEAGEYGLRWSKSGEWLFFNAEKKIMAMHPARPGIVEVARAVGRDVSVSLIDISNDERNVLIAEYDSEGLPEFIVPRYTGKDVSTKSARGGISKVRFGLAPIDTGATVWVTLPDTGRYFSGDVAISPDGKQCFIERFSSNRKKREIFIADTDSGKAKLIYEEQDKAWVEGGLATTRWTPDGKQLISTSEREGWNHLYRMNPDGRSRTKLTDGKWEIRWFDIAPTGDRVFFLANKDEHHQWQLYSLELKSRAITRLSTSDGTYESPQMAKDGSFIAARYSRFAHPGELVRVPTTVNVALASSASANVSPATGEIILTKSIPVEFSNRVWTIPEIIHFKATDGTTVPAMIYKPKNFDPAKKYPVVVFVHGAGYLQNVFRGWSYYYREYMFHHRLTQRGYVVFEVDYRGSAGYGRKFRADVAMHLGGKDLQDELDGLEYLNGLGYIDSTRVGIYGGSYGGFMALMGLFRSEKYACGAALRAVTSWENYYRHNSWYTEARLGKPEANPEAYTISSPITYADSLKKPLLILHGMVDDNVYFQDAVQLTQKLQKAGKPFEIMFYPDEPHSYTEPESWFDQYRRIEEFFDEHLLHPKF